jgi:hypothetical protein
MDLAVDNSGNVFTTGILTTTLAFGSTTLTGTGANDVFLAKYDNDGNVLWAKSAGTSVSADESRAVAADNTGNVIIAGTFEGTSITFDGTTLSCPNAGRNIFVVKYDGLGNLVWARSVDFTNYVIVGDIATDGMDNIFVVGSNTLTATGITFGSITLNSTAAENPFLVKYDSGGNVIWAKNGNAGSTSHNYANGVATDTQGNVYVTGPYMSYSSDPFTFGGFTPPVTYNQSVYLIKFDNSGNGLWAKNSVNSNNYDSFSFGNGVATDKNDNVIITGNFSGDTVSFGSVKLASNGVMSAGDIFVAKYNNAGSLSWAKKAGGSDDDSGSKIACDSVGNIYISGYFKSVPASFGGVNISKADATETTFFGAKYDKLGSVSWVKYADNTNAYNVHPRANGIGVDKCNNVFIGASTDANNVAFGTLTLVKGGVFTLKLGDTQVGIFEHKNNNNSFVIYPNPTAGVFTIKSNETSRYDTIEVCNIHGQVIFKSAVDQTVDLSGEAKGIYLVRIITETNIYSQKIIIR